jgi:bacterioferritin-associated ferredoxin
MRLHLRLLCEAHTDDSIVSAAVSGSLDSVDVEVTHAYTGIEPYCGSCARSMLHCVTSWSSCDRNYIVCHLLVHLYILVLRSTSLPDMSLTGLRQAGLPGSLIDTTIVWTHVSSHISRMHKSTT